MKKVAAILGFAFLLFSCKEKNKVAIVDADVLHENQFRLTEVIIYDVFTPPVASRIYVYSSLASYEAIRHSKPGSVSIAAKLHGFMPMPEPEKGKTYNYTLAATRAFFSVVHKVVFSLDSLKGYEEATYERFKNSMDEDTYTRSLAFGDSIGKIVIARAMKDGYPQSRGKQKYLGSNEPGKWRPTPPDYLDGVEWCWNTMKPMVLDSAAQFMPVRPPAYSTDSTSPFFIAAKEVYTVNKNLTDSLKMIAKYWDDNPFVIEHSGHMMFGNKKITPGGHWMGIAGIAAKESKADAVKTALTFSLTAISLYDAFISCWDEKYRSSLVRPVTVINELIDRNFSPYLQTPPFPEYISGHSSITASASTVLTELYGDNFAFRDTSDLRYIGMERNFKSFKIAAAEAAISRLYGGIHYRFGVEVGADQGKKVGAFIVKKLLK